MPALHGKDKTCRQKATLPPAGWTILYFWPKFAWGNHAIACKQSLLCRQNRFIESATCRGAGVHPWYGTEVHRVVDKRGNEIAKLLANCPGNTILSITRANQANACPKVAQALRPSGFPLPPGASGDHAQLAPGEGDPGVFKNPFTK